MFSNKLFLNVSFFTIARNLCSFRVFRASFGVRWLKGGRYPRRYERDEEARKTTELATSKKLSHTE